jgi:hypothetical protein
MLRGTSIGEEAYDIISEWIERNNLGLEDALSYCRDINRVLKDKNINDLDNFAQLLIDIVLTNHGNMLKNAMPEEYKTLDAAQDMIFETMQERKINAYDAMKFIIRNTKKIRAKCSNSDGWFGSESLVPKDLFIIYNDGFAKGSCFDQDELEKLLNFSQKYIWVPRQDPGVPININRGNPDLTRPVYSVPGLELLCDSSIENINEPGEYRLDKIGRMPIGVPEPEPHGKYIGTEDIYRITPYVKTLSWSEIKAAIKNLAITREQGHIVRINNYDWRVFVDAVKRFEAQYPGRVWKAIRKAEEYEFMIDLAKAQVPCIAIDIWQVLCHLIINHDDRSDIIDEFIKIAMGIKITWKDFDMGLAGFDEKFFEQGVYEARQKLADVAALIIDKIQGNAPSDVIDNLIIHNGHILIAKLGSENRTKFTRNHLMRAIVWKRNQAAAYLINDANISFWELVALATAREQRVALAEYGSTHYDHR